MENPCVRRFYVRFAGSFRDRPHSNAGLTENSDAWLARQFLPSDSGVIPKSGDRFLGKITLRKGVIPKSGDRFLGKITPAKEKSL
jgi:hypothetical protein